MCQVWNDKVQAGPASWACDQYSHRRVLRWAACLEFNDLQSLSWNSNDFTFKSVFLEGKASVTNIFRMKKFGGSRSMSLPLCPPSPSYGISLTPVSPPPGVMGPPGSQIDTIFSCSVFWSFNVILHYNYYPILAIFLILYNTSLPILCPIVCTSHSQTRIVLLSSTLLNLYQGSLFAFVLYSLVCCMLLDSTCGVIIQYLFFVCWLLSIMFSKSSNMEKFCSFIMAEWYSVPTYTIYKI